MQPTDETFGDSDNINISSHSASMTGGGSIEYSATGLSGSGLSINTSTGAIIGTGPTSVVGIYSGIIITAKDNSADCMTAAAYAYCRIDSNSFEIEIAASGGGDPTWTSNVPMMQTNLTYTTDTSISSINLSAQTDPGGNSVSYNASGLPPGLTLAGNLISGVPETSGVYSVTLKATDQSNNNFIQTIVTFNIDPSNSMDVYWVDQTPASGTIGEYTANTNVDLTFSAEIDYDNTDIRYRLISNMGIIPGRTTALPENELPSWLTWESNAMYDNPTTDTGVAEITGTTPSQDIDYNYAFTVRAFVQAQEATDFNDRDFVIKVLEDASCVSPVNNICT